MEKGRLLYDVNCFSTSACAVAPRIVSLLEMNIMQMKKLVVIAAFAAVCMGASAQNFTIEGRFTDVKNDTLMIEYVKREPDKEIVNVKVPIDADGRFKYSCDIKYAYSATLAVQSKDPKSSFFFVPDESVRVEGPSVSDNYWKSRAVLFIKDRTA